MSGVFIESTVWNGLDNVDMTEINALIGKSLGYSPRMERNGRKGPEYLPVPSSKYIGKVTYFNAERGFGKIGRNGVFFHISEVKDGNASYVCEGITVAYEEGVDAKNGREKAVDVQIVPERG